VKVRALLAERRQRIGYERLLAERRQRIGYERLLAGAVGSCQ